MSSIPSWFKSRLRERLKNPSEVSVVTSLNEDVLGHSAWELERLRRQAQLVNPITRQYLIEAGIATIRQAEAG